MSLQKLLAQIESESFVSSVNVVSTRRAFIEALFQNTDFTNLVKSLRDNADYRTALLARIRELATSQINHRYENPYDTAMATYAWALTQVSPKIARIGAELLTSARQTWWAREIAALILEEIPVSFVDDVTESQHQIAPDFQIGTIQVFLKSIDTPINQMLSMVPINTVSYRIPDVQKILFANKSCGGFYNEAAFASIPFYINKEKTGSASANLSDWRH